MNFKDDSVPLIGEITVCYFKHIPIENQIYEFYVSSKTNGCSLVVLEKWDFSQTEMDKS